LDVLLSVEVFAVLGCYAL